MRAPRFVRPPRNGPAPVAQPDRVVASEAIGRGFESLRARHCSAAGSGLPDLLIACCGLAATDGWIVRNYDLDFLKKFSMVLGFLVVVTLGLILLASHLNGLIPTEVTPQAAQRTDRKSVV